MSDPHHAIDPPYPSPTTSEERNPERKKSMNGPHGGGGAATSNRRGMSDRYQHFPLRVWFDGWNHGMAFRGTFRSNVAIPIYGDRAVKSHRRNTIHARRVRALLGP